MTSRLLVIAAAAAAALTASPAAASGGVELRRIALAVGANDGGAGRTVLRYAGSDARAFAGVLRDLGGTRPADVIVLDAPSVADIEAGFARAAGRIAEARASGAGVRVEFLLYYSGHSDEEGLLIAGQKLSYEELRRRIAALPADVHIAILDSCASGAFTLAKGGERLPAFLIDEANQVSGHAFLTSSSADEQAQESERLGGSFFTHYLVGGLRGAADANRDHRVTLGEAYQFAFAETLGQTQKSRFGAQHPAYDMHLVGTGDVILTDLGTTTAALVLADDVSGRVFVRDDEQRLVLELTKVAGTQVLLALGPQTYHVIVDRSDGRRLGAVVQLREGSRTTLGLAQLGAVAVEATVARGGAPGAEPTVYTGMPVNLDLVSVPRGERSRHIFSLNLLVGGGALLDGFELGGLVNIRTDGVSGVQIAGLGNVNGGNSRALQIGGLFNSTTGSAAIGQIGGLGNWVGGDVDGIQIAGLGNITGGDVGRRGLGVQIAGLGNMVDGDVRGLQIAGLGNVANGGVEGVQIALVNVGGSVRGAQVGVVNVARRASGLQLGVVNVATESSRGAVPIGLVNAAPDGHRAVEAWAADIVPLRVGAKVGYKNVYALYALGVGDDLLAAGIGLGVHLPKPSYWIDFDATSYVLVDGELDTQAFDWDGADQLAELRIMLGIPLDVGLSVFGGVSANTLIQYGQGKGDSLLPATTWTTDSVRVRLSPGLFAGISY